MFMFSKIDTNVTKIKGGKVVTADIVLNGFPKYRNVVHYLFYSCLEITGDSQVSGNLGNVTF